MEKKLFLLFISLCLFFVGCTKNIETKIKETVKNNIETIPNYHIKRISYLKANRIIANEIKYNDVYVVKVSSQDGVDYDIDLILDKNADIITTSSYIFDSDNSIKYVYKMDIFINDKKITDEMYNKIIDN